MMAWYMCIYMCIVRGPWASLRGRCDAWGQRAALFLLLAYPHTVANYNYWQTGERLWLVVVGYHVLATYLYLMFVNTYCAE